MKKTIIIIWLGIVLVLSSVIVFVGMGSAYGKVNETTAETGVSSKTLTSHAPIYIDGNADFSDADDDGVSNPGAAGTESDPYIIENWDISASSAHGIKIENTNVYFVIRNCVIHDGKTDYNRGIYFYNVTNGKIDNVTSYNNYVGIQLSSSSNNTITKCTVYNNTYGIRLAYSSNNNMSDNVFTNDDIFIQGDLDDCVQTIENNTVNGKPLYYFLNQDGVTLDSIEVGQLILVNSTNFNIKNLDISYTDIGIELLYSSNNQITNCTVYNNSHGIYLHCCSNNNITNCSVYNNSGDGIYLGSSSNNNITNCSVYNNSHGIYLYSSSNNILEDNILENNTYNFGVRGLAISNFYQDIDTTNTVNGKPIYYMMEENGIVFNESMGIGYLGLISCTNIKVEKLTLTDNIQGLLLANTSYSTISNCSVYNNYRGIYLWGFYGACNHNNISNCDVYNNSWYGIGLEDASNNNIITNCNVYNNSMYGIWLWYSSNNQISNCNVYNNSHGIYLESSSNNNITNCNVYNNYGCGILLWSSSNNQITNCDVYNNSRGIRLDFSSNNEIHYNNIYSNTNYGIYNYNTDSAYVVNATYNWWGDANSPGDAVSDNVIYDPWLMGFWGEIPPEVMGTYPMNSSVDVPVDISIEIIFSRSMSISTISRNITIEPYVGIKNYSWSNGNKTLTLTFVINLSSFTQYTITVNTNVQDDGYVQASDGTMHYVGSSYLQNTYHFSFRTKDVTPPIANAGLDKEVNEDEIVELNASLSWDNVGIINWTWDFTDQGEEVFLYGEVMHYVFTQPGFYVIMLNVSDAAGNWAVDTVNITVKDVTPPIITIISPKNNTITNQSVTLIYFVSDNFDEMGNITITGPENNTVYSDEEEYIITINASDKTGNNATKTTTFIIDKTLPIIFITSPEDGLITNQDVTLDYSFSDEMSSSENITVTGDESPYTEEGNYSIMLTATDQAGNTAQDTVTFIIDKTKPTISELTPATGTKTTDGSIVVSGKTEPDADVKINGMGVSVDSDGSFSKEVTLTKGENTITITATDLAGNTKTETIIVTKTEKKEEKGFIPGFEVFILIIAFAGCAILLKNRKRFNQTKG